MASRRRPPGPGTRPDRRAGRSSCRLSPSPAVCANARAKEAMMNPAAMAPSRVGLRMGGAGYSCALVTTAGAQRPPPPRPRGPDRGPASGPRCSPSWPRGWRSGSSTRWSRPPGRRPGWTTSSTSARCRSCSPTAQGFIAPFKLVFDHVDGRHGRAPAALLGRARRPGADRARLARRAAPGRRGLRRGHDPGAGPARAAGSPATAPGLIAAGLAAVYPTLIAADGALMSETLYGALVALALLAAYRLLDAPERRAGAGARRGRPRWRR